MNEYEISLSITASYHTKCNSAVQFRGRRVFEQDFVDLISYHPDKRKALFSIDSESMEESYDVMLEFDPYYNIRQWSCECIASRSGFCKHAVAASMQIAHDILHNFMPLNQKFSSTHISLKKLAQKDIEALVPHRLKTATHKLLKNNAVSILQIHEGKATTTVQDGKSTYKVDLTKQQGHSSIATSCDCEVGDFQLCTHQLATLFALAHTHGQYAFEESFDWSKEKAYMLSEYGLDFNSDYSKHAEFTFTDGSLDIVLKNKSLIPLSVFSMLTIPTSNEPPKMPESSEFGVGYAFLYQRTWEGSHMAMASFTAKYNKNGVLGTQLKTVYPDYANYQYESLCSSADMELNNLNKQLNHTCNQIEDKLAKHAHDAVLKLFQKRHSILESIFELLPPDNCFVDTMAENDRLLKFRTMEQVKIAEHRIISHLDISQNDSFVKIKIRYTVDGKDFAIRSQFLEDNAIIYSNGYLYQWANAYCMYPYILTGSLSQKEVSVPIASFNSILPFIKQIQEHIPVTIQKTMITEARTELAIRQIHLSESGNFMIVKPVMQYGSTQITVTKTPITDTYNQLSDKGIVQIVRDTKAESEFYHFVCDQHQSFKPTTNQDYFFISIHDALKKLWFIRFCQKCKDSGIEIFGTKNLKKINYYPGTATINYQSSSDVDWFNVNISVSFGEHTVSLKDVQKAVAKNNGMIKLSDDTLGVLPEEWIQKWGTALELGKVKDNELKLTKSQFGIIHSLYEDLQNQDLLEEISEKLLLLDHFEKLEPIKRPTQLKAKLRDYQQSGLNWLAFLTQFKLGGCLADDMGLGKTVQMIALMCYLKHTKKEKGTHLVVCPTTLLFNWEREIEKFAPSLTYYRHWGIGRITNAEEWGDVDVVLTSYGTLANDIKSIGERRFKSVILDESQAIKNPGSLRFKAVCIVKADYKFTMTGTPIENNTMELFAQMQFLNPGLLGTMNHFRKEFAGPIDKGEAPHKADELRKLVYPFLLRRTKEVVATELPAKTEMVLYCEMGEKQRKVYDAFMNEYRSKILNEVDSEGMNNARFTILDALLKARQICDSPALLNTEEDYGDESVKIDELLRHIEDKTRNHKVLVFSQFVGMLTLIRTRLDADGVHYSYLDGSTSNREKVVDEFVQDDTKRVFLISLKAGGYGLNLTVADYVYLVDPWWNPAVESQAIDRVHRIGQDKKVFAYRMICKDTIEEKIIKLQEKKKDLAKEIVASEQSFVKNLTRDDIEDLFV